ncbi:MAG: Hsp33 family molecular chaperone HslO [Gammaproteobacteria bacterium]|nr:Hsp33 family molecular chaperone HslO [Gammaproteobacteria bacterium]
MPAAPASDLVRRFIFEAQPVRGHWVRLENAWRELRAHADYPPEVTALLGEAVVAAVLLAATLKFRGTLTFQLEGNGAVPLLVAQCTHDFRLRAVARCDAAALERLGATAARLASFRGLAGTDGRLTVTVEAEERSMRYQGVVPLSGGSLAESLEAYFGSSEQLPTRVAIAADGTRAAGVLLQRLPGGTQTPADGTEAWDAAQRGVTTLSRARLLEGSADELLAGGFPDHDLRLFRGAPVRFECRCGAGRVAGLLRALGEDEMRGVLQEQGAVTVTCEFCHRPYRFEAADLDALFAEASAPGAGSQAIH